MEELKKIQGMFNNARYCTTVSLMPSETVQEFTQLNSTVSDGACKKFVNNFLHNYSQENTIIFHYESELKDDCVFMQFKKTDWFFKFNYEFCNAFGTIISEISKKARGINQTNFLALETEEKSEFLFNGMLERSELLREIFNIPELLELKRELCCLLGKYFESEDRGDAIFKVGKRGITITKHYIADIRKAYIGEIAKYIRSIDITPSLHEIYTKLDGYFTKTISEKCVSENNLYTVCMDNLDLINSEIFLALAEDITFLVKPSKRFMSRFSEKLGNRISLNVKIISNKINDEEPKISIKLIERCYIEGSDFMLLSVPFDKRFNDLKFLGEINFTSKIALLRTNLDEEILSLLEQDKGLSDLQANKNLEFADGKFKIYLLPRSTLLSKLVPNSDALSEDVFIKILVDSIYESDKDLKALCVPRLTANEEFMDLFKEDLRKKVKHQTAQMVKYFKRDRSKKLDYIDTSIDKAMMGFRLGVGYKSENGAFFDFKLEPFNMLRRCLEESCKEVVFSENEELNAAISEIMKSKFLQMGHMIGYKFMQTKIDSFYTTGSYCEKFREFLSFYEWTLCDEKYLSRAIKTSFNYELNSIYFRALLYRK
jgi:hypothetical protein